MWLEPQRDLLPSNGLFLNGELETSAIDMALDRWVAILFLAISLMTQKNHESKNRRRAPPGSDHGDPMIFAEA